MEKELAKLVIDTHGLVKSLEGVVKGNGAEGMVHDVKKNREDIEFIRNNMVSDAQCKERTKGCIEMSAGQVKQIIEEALKEKGRNKWLIAKDIILLLIGPGSVGALIILGLLGKLGSGQ